MEEKESQVLNTFHDNKATSSAVDGIANWVRHSGNQCDFSYKVI